MAQFYKELKELREARKISLEEISERTKINVQYLNAIESGEFSEIETPYLRLFLRAYAEEIGGDSQKSLEQLDSFMGTKRPSVFPTSINDEENNDTNDPDMKHLTIFSDKNIRSDYFIAIIFSLILIFAIIVFQKIFNEESKAIVTTEGPILQQKIEPITNEDLLKDFIIDKSSEESLSISPPFFIKIKTIHQTAYTFQNDSSSPNSQIINANQEKNLDPFVNLSELIFSSTKGLILFINGTEIKEVSEYENPLKIVVKPKPSSVAIHRYKPLISLK